MIVRLLAKVHRATHIENCNCCQRSRYKTARLTVTNTGVTEIVDFCAGCIREMLRVATKGRVGKRA